VPTVDGYDRYSKYIVKSVNHIFKRFLDDHSVREVYEMQARDDDPQVAVEIDGSLHGEIVINLPQETLDLITRKFIGSKNKASVKKNNGDVAGEIANLITGTFANQLQYDDHDIRLSPPEFNDDPIELKTLYNNVNISFDSTYGGFDIDFYYKEH